MDKGKSNEIKDKVLFIDARNYYTMVDRTLNEWSDWQLKNLNVIVWERKVRALLTEYRQVLGYVVTFEESLQLLKVELKDLQKCVKIEVEHAGRSDKKRRVQQ